jgi:hypothetical protein
MVLYLTECFCGIQPAKAEAAEKANVVPVVMSSYPAVIRVKASDWLSLRRVRHVVYREPNDDCFVLRLIRLRSVGMIQVTSSGLGNIDFTTVKGETCDFAKVQPVWSTELTIPKLTKNGEKIAMRIKSSHPARLGTKLTGKLLILSDGYQPRETEITIDGSASSDFWLAVTWAFGIGIPALLTFWLGLLGQRLKSASDDEDRFFKYRFEKYATINSFFKEHYQTYSKENDLEFMRLCYLKLVEAMIFDQVPRKHSQKLLKFIKEKNRKRFKEALSVAFPEWRMEIR